MNLEHKVLFITSSNPYTKNNGDYIYSASILDNLVKLSCKIDIVYFNSNPNEPYIDADRMQFNKSIPVKFKRKNKIKLIFSGKPGSIANRNSILFLKEISNLLQKQKYDSVFVNHFRMLFTLPTIQKYKNRSKIIFISHNVESLLNKNLLKFQRNWLYKIAYWQDYLKTKIYEKRSVKCFSIVTVISEYDAEYFKKIFQVKDVRILRPIIQLKAQDFLNQNEKKINNVIIGGSFTWKPKKENLLLFLNAKNFYKLFQLGISVTVVGMAEKNFIDYVNNKFNGVNMIGPVSSMWPFYQKSKIAIIPERLGGGFKLKILEAAQTKTAIIAIEGAIKKSNFKKNIHYFEKNNFEDIVEEIINMQENSKKLESIIRSSYKLVNEQYTNHVIRQSLKEIIS